MAAIKKLTLYSYFHSSASWRIRAVLALKKIPFEYETVHLVKGDQHKDDFVKISPMHQVPAMKVELDDGTSHVLTQSLAIIQYLEDNYPQNPIYPKDPLLCAKARAIADTISGGIQPLQNHETLMFYVEPLGMEQLSLETRHKVAAFWISRKLATLEELVKKTAGKYCVGDELTVADFALVPQMFNARRFGADTSKCPTLVAIDERLNELEIIKVSHPMACPDTPIDK